MGKQTVSCYQVCVITGCDANCLHVLTVLTTTSDNTHNQAGHYKHELQIMQNHEKIQAKGV